MKVAISLCQKLVAPRFDCAEEFLIVLIIDRQVRERSILKCSEENPLRKTLLMTRIPVDVILCCSIDNFSLRLLEDHKIAIVNGQHGLIEEVLNQWLKLL